MPVEILSPIVVPEETPQSDLDRFWTSFYVDQIDKRNIEKENSNVTENGKPR